MICSDNLWDQIKPLNTAFLSPLVGPKLRQPSQEGGRWQLAAGSWGSVAQEAARLGDQSAFLHARLAEQSVRAESMRVGLAKPTAWYSARAPETPACDDRCIHQVPCLESRLTFPTGSSALLPALALAPALLAGLPASLCGQGQGKERELSPMETTWTLSLSPVSL